MAWLVLCLAGCQAPPPVSSTQGVMPPRYLFSPVDDAATVPQLYATRAAVLEALRAGDPETVVGPTGKRPDAWHTLARWMGHREPPNDPFVQIEMARFEQAPMRVRQLSEMLRYGGVFMSPERRSFCAPYWWSLKPTMTDLPVHLQGDRLPWVVIAPETVVRAEPSREAPVLHTLTLELIRVLEDERADAERRFVAVQLDEVRGFVERASVRNLSDRQHACFTRGTVFDAHAEPGTRWSITEIEY